MNSTYVQLKQNLEYLKMKQMLLHLDEVLDFITANNLSFTEGLVKLTSHELLIIDELGYLPIEKDDAKLFFHSFFSD